MSKLTELAERVDLRFTNSDAIPKVQNIACDRDSVKPIMSWYGAFYAGDRYVVEANCVKLAKDHNGELVGELPALRSLAAQEVEA